METKKDTPYLNINFFQKRKEGKEKLTSYLKINISDTVLSNSYIIKNYNFLFN